MERRSVSVNRLEHLQQKRNEKLRFDLVQRYGLDKIDAIDSRIQQNSSELFQQGKSYNEVYSHLAGQLAKPTQESPKPNADHRQSEDKRPLPVKPREKIFDEWGAVMRHQHEMGELADLHEKMLLKEKQATYRKSLEEQRKKQEAKLKVKEDTGFFIKEEDKEKIKAEENQKAKALMEQNLEELKKMKELTKAKRLQEHKNEMEWLKKVQEEEEKKMCTEKEVKRHQIEAIKKAYAEQEAKKREEMKKVKERELAFLQSQRVQAYDSEKERQRYTEHLKDFERVNSIKESMYKSTIQALEEERRKADEEKRLQVIKEREQKELDRYYQGLALKRKDIETARNELKVQIDQKQLYRQLMKEEERSYAQTLRQKALAEEEKEKQRIYEERRKKDQYVNQLKAQIEEQNRLRKYAGLMSEYEKKQNQGDLAAYENNESKLNAKLVGIKVPSYVPETIKVPKIVPPSKIVEAAASNMQDPGVAFARHNTNNKAYGCSVINRKNPRDDQDSKSKNPLLLAGQSQVLSQPMAVLSNQPEIVPATPALARSTSQPNIEPRADMHNDLPRANPPTSKAEESVRSFSKCFSRYNIISGQNHVLTYPLNPIQE